MSAHKILIVDDEEIIARLLSISLKSDGYETVTANSGAEGLEKFKTESPDIVITDIKMPGMDGLELLKEIKAIDNDREVIIVTGHGDIDSTITALQYGASDFINKPVRDEALAIALARAKEKMEIRKKLYDYTHNLEAKVEEATEQIRRTSDFQRLLIKSSTDAIVAFDHEWTVVVYNSAAAGIMGQSAKDVLGKKTIDDIYDDPQVIKIYKDQAKIDSQEKTIPWKEDMLRVKGGREVPVRYTCNVLFEEGEFVGVVHFFQDLTVIKKLEEDLLQSERLAAVGQTISGLAHYVKNILIGLKGGSYVVDVGINNNDTKKFTTGWQTIKKNIKRVSDLTQDLLTYSKNRKPEIGTCKPNEIVNELVDLIKDFAATKDVNITQDTDPAIKDMTADPQTIHRSLLNLINNAIDACVEDEDIDKDHQVDIRTYFDDSSICFEVKDNGCGMDEEIQEKLFDPMFSSKGGKGTGLGLLVTAKLIQEHDGEIDVQTEYGKGSTFTIKLPYEKETRVGI